jgi:hypothetical protein
MAKSRPSVQKRINEARKIEKNQEKALRKAARKAAKDEDSDTDVGIDPDLAGIRPGPQPVRPDPLAVDE